MHRRYQEAIEAYSRSPRLSPAIWNKMGIAYQMMFNAKDAARCYNQSLKLNPRNSQVINNLATVYDSEKNFRAGERYYRKALRLDPNSAISVPTSYPSTNSKRETKCTARLWRSILGSSISTRASASRTRLRSRIVECCTSTWQKDV
jgi:tetratricopeptide (TPR) repeat protein